MIVLLFLPSFLPSFLPTFLFSVIIALDSGSKAEDRFYNLGIWIDMDYLTCMILVSIAFSIFPLFFVVYFLGAEE